MTSRLSNVRGREVLICGRESSDLKELRALIGTHGFSVGTARTPVSAIQQIRSSAFTAVVILLAGDDEAWLETITAFNDLFPDLPVIVLASQASLETERKARQRRIFYYLLKPFDTGEIRAVLQDATGRAQA
ncbi:MAG: response regulator [Acidobacteria bacterium]|nr:MAG: response regulator [Acidobacteriota bacterium]